MAAEAKRSPPHREHKFSNIIFFTQVDNSLLCMTALNILLRYAGKCDFSTCGKIVRSMSLDAIYHIERVEGERERKREGERMHGFS